MQTLMYTLIMGLYVYFYYVSKIFLTLYLKSSPRQVTNRDTHEPAQITNFLQLLTLPEVSIHTLIYGDKRRF